MNTQERRARFTEICATLELLPDIESDEYNPVIPKGTMGFADGNLKTAIMAQAMRGDEVFKGNLINALANTGFEACKNKHEADEPLSDDDLGAVTLAIHIAWAVGALAPMLMLLGTIGKMLIATDTEVPDDLPLIFRSNAQVEKKTLLFDPYELLDMDNKALMEHILKLEAENDFDE